MAGEWVARGRRVAWGILAIHGRQMKVEKDEEQDVTMS